jgi:Phytanoyl-CoA dioxygenase (PhyH)
MGMNPSATLDQAGAVVSEGVVSDDAVSRLRKEFQGTTPERAGVRSFDVPSGLGDLIGPHGAMGALAAKLAGRPARPVRVLFFDKTPVSNWAVPWHQDRTIAVKERRDIDGYGPWSRKGGIVHVEPPVPILEGMLALRLFVDDCGVEDGPLEVAIGSHRRGRVPVREVCDIAAKSAIFTATGKAGDVLAIKALAIHRSKRAVSPSRRGTLHVDYALVDVPELLEWAFAGE